MADYTPQQVTEALTQLVACRGQVGDAVGKLSFKLPVSTLRGWRDSTHAEQYRRLERTHGDDIEEELIARARANALAAAEAVEVAIEKTLADLKGNRIKDPAKAAQHLATVADSSVKKLMLLTGRPTERNEDRTMAETVALLMEKGILKPAEPAKQLPPADAEATAVEEPLEPEPVPEPQAA